MTHIKENIISKLQKLYSPVRNLGVGNKSHVLYVKNHFARVIYWPHAKYSLKGLQMTGFYMKYNIGFKQINDKASQFIQHCFKDAYLGSYQTSMKELFCKNSYKNP